MMCPQLEEIEHNLAIQEIENIIRKYYIQLQFSKTDPYVTEPDLIQTVIRLVPENMGWALKFKVSRAIINFDKKRPRNMRKTANHVLCLIQKGK